MDVCQGTEKLIHIQLDLQHWHSLLQLDVVPGRAVDGLRYVFEDKVKINFVLLLN